MRVFVVAIFLAVTYNIAIAQSITSMNDYSEEWAVIDSLIREGLPKSALGEVNKLSQRAQSENNQPQWIKTIMYANKCQMQLEEDGFENAIARLKTEMGSAGFPAKAILQSMLGEMYQSYLRQNIWDLRDRTETNTTQSDDLKTWTISQLADEAAKYYWRSLAQEKELAGIPIKAFSAITTEPANTDRFRPTLFDFLAHRAIQHFSSDQSYLSRPKEQFYIKDKAAFWDAVAFADHAFTTTDTSSGKYQTLLLFQRLLKLHQNDEQPDALIDADLSRLQFVYNNTIVERADEHYAAALQRIYDQNEKNDLAAEAAYYIANLYHTQGQRYNPSYLDEVMPPDEKEKWGFKKAVDLSREMVEKYPDSRGAQLCQSLINRITRPSLEFKAEEVNLPEQPIMTNVVFRNLDGLHIKIVKISEADHERIEYGRKDRWEKFLSNAEPLRQYREDLPETQDYHRHSVEIMLQPLPYGLYGVLVSDQSDFDEKANTGYVLFQVSNIAFLRKEQRGESPEFAVVHRKTGAPLAGVTANFFELEYRRRGNYKINDAGEALTDQYGFVKPPKPSNNLSVKFTRGEDRFLLSENASSYIYTSEERNTFYTKIFTDRAIYRPGQTIYFKALLFAKEAGEDIPRITPDREVSVTFYDANGQQVEELQLESNEYGTVQGSFTAPTTGLLGQMRLVSNYGGQGHYFRVEEYKRPRFEVELQPFEEDYALEDTVTVDGIATAFAGNFIDGAQVTYRVERNVSYPWWPFFLNFRYPTVSAPTTIAYGETLTDKSGQFSIPFPALPDYNVDPDNKPMFSYTVSVDVIDITGETHSASKTISLSYVGIKVSLEVPEEYDRNDPFSVEVRTTNLDGQAIAADCNLSIEKLQIPDQTFVERYWQLPDLYKYDNATYRKNFPHFAYKLENTPAFAPVEYEVYQDSFNTGDKILFTVPASFKWEPGSYKATVRTTDEKGNEVEQIQFFVLYDSKSNQIPKALQFKAFAKNTKPLSEYDINNYNPQQYEPGDNSLIRFIAGDDLPTFLLFEMERKGTPFDREWKSFKAQEQFTYQVKESDRGNLFYHTAFVKNNRAFTQFQRLDVPWSNKELKLEFATFRDKLKPGQAEEWQIKISGTQKDRVAAEMLATMYDASLDQFAVNEWSFSPFPNYYYTSSNWTTNYFGINQAYIRGYYGGPGYYVPPRIYRSLNWFGLLYSSVNRAVFANGLELREAASISMRLEDQAVEAEAAQDAVSVAKMAPAPPPPPIAEVAEERPAEPQEFGYDSQDESIAGSEIQVRTNLNETVFFFPQLQTDEEGNVILKFTMNEALTRWKFLGFAHTKDLSFGMLTKEVVTQKELMVLPNPPRFMREGDEITFTAKVSNLTENTLQGTAELHLFDAITMEPVDELFQHTQKTVPFTTDSKQSAPLAWDLQVPAGKVPALVYRVTAKAGDFSDGEENSLPVVPNRMMVTESLPLSVRGRETKSLTLEKLANANTSNTLSHHNLTLEFSSNPAWYAVQALPYLMEFPYECTEQIFNRLYANSLAESVVVNHPKIKDLFTQWKDTDALLSNLQKNEALKTAILEETPWVLQAQSEEQQKKNIGLLFDMSRMSQEKSKIVAQLAERQSPSGGFPWFPGGRDSWYITQYLVEGFGHLEQLGIAALQSEAGSSEMISNAVAFIDSKMLDHYHELENQVAKGYAKWEDNHLNPIVIHYLYARSFYFDKVEIDQELKKVMDYYLDQAEQYWLKQGLYQQALIGLSASRSNRMELSGKVIRSLKERALQNDELGMYWQYPAGYFWHQLPIETHTAMLELFAEVAKDEAVVNELKIWLLKNKQTNHWETTKATAAAVFALFNYGDNWLEETEPVKITLPELKKREYQDKIEAAQAGSEPGTGYFKTEWQQKDINEKLATVKIKNPNKTIAWGGLYWQYFEELDKITKFEETPLQLKRQLYKSTNSEAGDVLTEINDNNELEPGDKLMVRLELRVDRDMEYVHMKDMRASGFEPINVLSQYKWQGGLGYYESTRDVATHFFFDYLPKGTYVFEYPLRAVHKGSFSNGITSIQSMYAPEFSSHSEGIRVEVK